MVFDESVFSVSATVQLNFDKIFLTWIESKKPVEEKMTQQNDDSDSEYQLESISNSNVTVQTMEAP